MLNLQYPESMNTFHKYQTIFLINTNLRQELPILNFYIQQLIINNLNLKIFSINSKHTFSNAIIINESELFKMQQGRSKILYYIQGPCLFVSGSTSSIISNLLLKIINKLQEFGILCNMLNTCVKYNTNCK